MVNLGVPRYHRPAINDDSGIAGYAAEPGIDLVTGWGSSTLLRAITESCGSGAAMKEAAYPSA
jgi:hypothetical protein